MKGETPPVAKTMTLLMLPNDLLFNCLARVSRLYYPALSFVSKRFRSLITSRELYKTRILLNRTENCLYVCFKPLGDSNGARWFTLCLRPTRIIDPNPNPNPNPKSRCFTPCFRPYRFLMNHTRKKEKSSDNVLVSVPMRNSPLVNFGWRLVAVGCNIYKIGGYNNGLPSARVFFMDCRSHIWQEAQSMMVAREYPRVSVLDGKIYVAGGAKDLDPSNWMECFDTITQIWEHVPGPSVEICRMFLYKSLAIEGKLYLFGDKKMVYKPKEHRWDELELMDIPLGWVLNCSCVIDNILYSYRWSQRLVWHDFEGRCWRDLKGLEKLPKLPNGYNCVRLVGYGGKIAVFWEKDVGAKKKKIWCAEIVLERRNKHKIRGKVEWCDVVLTVPKSCDFFQFLAVKL